jgi:predicted negative regulator of RcsB-dependent stress response
MEWMIDNWLLILIPALLGALFFFGYRTNSSHDTGGHSHAGQTHNVPAGKVNKKGGHSCCH